MNYKEYVTKCHELFDEVEGASPDLFIELHTKMLLNAVDVVSREGKDNDFVSWFVTKLMRELSEITPNVIFREGETAINSATFDKINAIIEGKV